MKQRKKGGDKGRVEKRQEERLFKIKIKRGDKVRGGERQGEMLKKGKKRGR